MNATYELNKIKDLEQLPVVITYVAEVEKDWGGDKKQTVDQWMVKITHKNGFFTTDYFTGLGLRKPKMKGWDPKPVNPKVADVLYSLTSDAEACDYCFNDWCDTFGYDSDSIKAFKIYQACCEVGLQLRKVFTSQQLTAIRELLQDY